MGALHGQVVKLATNSKDYLNPMDIQLSHKGDKEALKLKSDFIITLCDLIAGGKDGLENDEKGIIDECIRHIYDGYFENPVPENMPILEDLYNALLKHKNKKRSVSQTASCCMCMDRRIILTTAPTWTAITASCALTSGTWATS